MSESAKLSEKFILVVDDEKDVANYLGAILEDAGFDVAVATSGDEALEITKKRTPDLVSLDLVMPEKGGIRYLYALRKESRWANIPVMIVTGHAHDDLGRNDLEEILSGRKVTGPQLCLEKPVRPASYVAAVCERLGLAETVAPSAEEEAPDTRDRVVDLLGTASPDTLKAVLRLLQQKRASGESGEKPEGAKVLVIDDEPDVASYMSAILSDAGFVTSTASDPQTAVAVAEASAPDLITLDIDMPGKDGIAVYGEIRATESLRDVPVVVITGVEESREHEFEGIAAYLKKPVAPQQLVDTANIALRCQGKTY